MRWITRERAMVDRIACPWLIKNFVDPKAEFFFVSQAEVMSKAEELDAIPFDVAGAELNHYLENGEEHSSFDAIIKKYNLSDPTLSMVARIVRGADTKTTSPPLESYGLKALATGFRIIAKNDHENMMLQFPAYDALYAFCKTNLESGNKRT
ncbi:MAG TPA: chromate resistance protein ChrB domain-containing protein [Thermoplasmataceae archaeon]|nr:chromate resistance protein [Thermoplasmatales archaeon AK]HLH85413.1 chromate resistance protein ChrB domain-containing protein [Thermoplasmataceae archaeon]